MDMSPAATRAFATLLEARTGQQLAVSRRWRIETALKPLLKLREIASLDLLAAAVMSSRDRALADEVVEALLNNETFFFREPAAFDLAREALHRLAERRAKERRLRIWSIGCSTGQEVHSVAMLFAGDAARWEGWGIEIVGTDVSRAAIAQARSGLYSQFEIQRGLPVQSMLRWFESEGESWRVRPELRGMSRFQVHNALDPASSPLRPDLLLCRNVLLYFALPARAAAFERMAAAIQPDGYLMLGAGETVIGQTERFRAHRELRGLYHRA